MDTLVDFTEVIRNLAQAFQAVVTAGGLVLAGIWTYMLFVQKRQRYARADLMHDVRATLLDDHRVWLHVTVTIKNIGEVLIRLANGYVRIDQVLPLHDKVVAKLAGGASSREPNDSEIGWPTIDRCSCEWAKEVREIEPAETDRFHFDFVIPASLQVVEIYTHFQNVQDQPRQIGWNYTTVFDQRGAANKTLSSET